MSAPRPKPLPLRLLLDWLDSNDLPWMPPLLAPCTDRERELRRLRVHARRLIRRDLVARQGWPRTLTRALAWPVLAPLKTWLHLRALPAPPEGRFAAFIRITWLQLGHNLRIADQIEYRLDSPARLPLARLFLSCREQQILLDYAGRHRHGLPALDQKLVFARFCDTHGLPHPRILLQGDGPRLAAAPDWPATDVVLKPANLCQGQGVEILPFDPALRVWRATDGTPLTPDNLPGYARRRLGDVPWLVQARLLNPPAWHSLTPGPLSTLRIVTGRVPSENKPVIVAVQARFAIHNPHVDNVSAGGLSAFVDSASGRMNIGLSWNDTPREHSVHPVTGGHIDGALVPDWPALRDLALRAHEAAGDWTSIGWDVAATTLGSMLIEANLLWGAISYVPQGQLPFIEIMQAACGRDYAGLYASPRTP